MTVSADCRLLSPEDDEQAAHTVEKGEFTSLQNQEWNVETRLRSTNTQDKSVRDTIETSLHCGIHNTHKTNQ